MRFQFTHPEWLLLLLVALPAVFWLFWKSDVQIGAARRWTAMVLRTVIVLAVVFSIAGLQRLQLMEGMNVFFLIDRSDSIPSAQQEAARRFINEVARGKRSEDRTGVLVFGTDAAIESSPNPLVQVDKIHAVVNTDRTDISAAIRLATAAFPESGQKRLVLLSDGNENHGDAMAALLAAIPLDVSMDVVPLGVTRGNDVSVQKVALPSSVKTGQPFDLKIFAQSDQAQPATIRLYRNEQFMGEQEVPLSAGKNLFTLPQALTEPGFYGYTVHIDAPGDMVPQNNRGSSFTTVQGDPRMLVISSDPGNDEPLAAALQSARIDVRLDGLHAFPDTLAEMQSYDAIFLSNVAAGDMGLDRMRLLESAVRDFGVGLVAIGGDQAFAAGGYRGTPLETTLPVEMELSSKKVLPSGALVLIMHGMEFMDGNAISREIAIGVLETLGPQDEMGVLLWDGRERWLFELTKVGDKRALARQIAGMQQGDLPSFQNIMTMAHEGLKQSNANIKHIIVFSDGDPGRPSEELMAAIVADRITVSTILIAGHAGPEIMIWIAEHGNGRFYDVRSPTQLPQVFTKEAAVILKSAIFEEPFTPQLAALSEVVRGMGNEYPELRGYVATTPKARAEMPLVTHNGDPLLAHWQYGLGRAVAFTSDARAKWAVNWLEWPQYRQFWSQVAQWSLRRLDSADFNAEVVLEDGEGHITVEAVDHDGHYRNFLNLQAALVSPAGERETIRLEQTGPGYYEARFSTREIGSYLINLMEFHEGQLRGSQVLGASVSYSPEFAALEPNYSLLRRMAEISGGRVLDPRVDNPFLLDRQRTFRPMDLWQWLLKLAIVLFTVDVAVRRIQIDREEWLRATAAVRRRVFFWRGVPRPAEADQSLAALLARREEVRSTQTKAAEPRPDLFEPARPVITPQPEKTTKIRPSAPEPEPVGAGQPSASTTSRLLDAKRRAKKKMGE